MPSRRHFIRSFSLCGAAVLASHESFAQAPMVDEKNPTAVSLGYVADATKANKAKYPAYKEGQACGNCQLFQGKAGDAAGPCPLYAGQQVSAKGWCSAYVKKT